MLRSKGLTDKLIVLGIDGMDPRFSRAMVDEGKMPNLKKLIDMGAARTDLMLLGGMPTITPPMWATLATGCYPMTHSIVDYAIPIPGEPDMRMEAFLSPFCKAEQLWNVTAEAGKKTLVFHWPGGAWPPSSDSENLYVVDGTSPGAMGNTTHKRDDERVIIATAKCKHGGCVPYGATDSHVDCDITEVPRPELHFARGDMNDPRLQEYYDKYFIEGGTVFQDYYPSKSSIRNGVFWDDMNMFHLADWPTFLSLSPISEPEGWADAPADAKEFTIYYGWGKTTRPALILKNDGRYNQVAIYATKEATEPLCVLDEDVYTPNCPDTIEKNGTVCNIVRNIRLLEIKEDGSYVRMWASNASDVDNSDCWYPRWTFDKIKAACGPPSASSMSACQDYDMIIKCSGEQWNQCAQWQADAMIYMMENEGVEVVFSHFHGPDLSGHAYMKYLKNRDTSKYDESVIREWHANTYRWTDDYIGRFIPYIEKGWTVLLVSDHALICPEAEPNCICDNSGVNVGVMKELGFTVLKKDENGNELQEIDWSKTVAVQSATNTIHLNLKGRDRYGIVDPADKYEVEEQIITALYGYKDKKTGKRIVALALHEKDAVLLGMGGGDIIMMIHEDYNFDHGESLSTACGHNDTSVSPIFVAAGPGVKAGHTIKGYVREVDVAPTAAVLLGVDIPKDCEGAPAYQIFTEKM
ncbi:MAG: alkaline phosphatase family protein [Peptococcaceae bacterium]|nr:alkaline phosphatase family protein [Peptococcaceae bacterium]